MSRQNKVNKNHYDQGGRLTPDEMGRERARNQARGQDISKPRQTPAGGAKDRGAEQEPSRPRSAPEE